MFFKDKKMLMAATMTVMAALTACDNDDLNIGQSLTADSDKLNVSTASYNVTTRTIMADSVLCLSADCYLGRVRDPETGADVASEFTTQFHLLETTYVSPESTVISRWNGRAAADSCDIILYFGTPFRAADSLIAMKMRTTELLTPLEEGQRYYSNFSPLAAGLLRPGGINEGITFSYANLGETDAARKSSTYIPYVRIPLDDPYTAPDGTTYKNYGTYLMLQYYDHPERYANTYTFVHQVCPGFLFRITDGLGFHAQVTDIGLRTFYSVQGDTSIITGRLVLAGTREVLQTTQVDNDTATLRALAAETDHTYLKTPAGLFTEVTLPVAAIKQGHEGDSLLSAKLVLQRLNSQSSDPRLLAVPQTLLMVQKDSLKAFFENGRVPDNVTSYYAGYNNPVPTSSTYATNDNTYTFNNLSSLVTYLWNERAKGLKSDPQWEANHPDWNKMVLVPIAYSTSTVSSTTEVTSVRHDMSLASTRLVGGPANPNAINISVVYGKFK